MTQPAAVVLPPVIGDHDAAVDAAWFGSNPGRTCYARISAYNDLVLVVRQVAQGRDPPVLLRTWGRVEPVPEDEARCLALWDRFAHPQSGAR